MAVDRLKDQTLHGDILLSNVKELTFEFIDKNQQTSPQWYNDELPYAIRISLRLSDWGKISQIYTLSQSQIYYEKFK